jgi:hypothetical protein
MKVVADSSGTATVMIPVQTERPYGRDYLLRRARVYYNASEASITWAGIRGINLADGAQPLIGTNSSTQSSTTYDYFDIEATANYTITHNMAPASIALAINMNTSLGYVNLYGVRLTLDSTY